MNKFAHPLLTALLCFGITIGAYAQKVETRSVASFSSIHCKASIDLILTQGTRESLKIEAKNVDPDKIITEVKGGRLEISMEKGSYYNMDVKVYVTFNELKAISLSGSGDAICNSGISADEFEISLSGSGDVNIENLDASEVAISLSGSGDISISGRARKGRISMVGSGDIDAYGMVFKDCDASLSGSGDINFTATESANAKVHGSGDIRVKGNPSQRSFQTSGSGDIRAVD